MKLASLAIALTSSHQNTPGLLKSTFLSFVLKTPTRARPNLKIALLRAGWGWWGGE